MQIKKNTLDTLIEEMNDFVKTFEESESFLTSTVKGVVQIVIMKANRLKMETEISDEEIEKAATQYEPMVTRRAWVSACKWYREQLMKKK
jgi:hypothetical protein